MLKTLVDIKLNSCLFLLIESFFEISILRNSQVSIFLMHIEAYWMILSKTRYSDHVVYTIPCDIRYNSFYTILKSTQILLVSSLYMPQMWLSYYYYFILIPVLKRNYYHLLIHQGARPHQEKHKSVLGIWKRMLQYNSCWFDGYSSLFLDFWYSSNGCEQSNISYSRCNVTEWLDRLLKMGLWLFSTIGWEKDRLEWSILNCVELYGIKNIQKVTVTVNKCINPRESPINIRDWESNSMQFGWRCSNRLSNYSNPS